jgi:RNA polymerase sigma factor (sigma-70 family)
MTDDTDMGGGHVGFPTTALSAIVGATSDDAGRRRRSFATLVAAYWKPVYKHARVKWHKSNEDAKDIAQGFFARAMEKAFFATFDPRKARFRTFLRLCLDRYIAGEAKAGRAQKRGGDAILVSLDFEMAEGELMAAELSSPETVERIFDREWIRALFELAVESLRADCLASGKAVHLRLFEQLDLGAGDAGTKPSYEALAREHGISVTAVTNHLAWARRELRRKLLVQLREITATDDEFRSEARVLFGIEVK